MKYLIFLIILSCFLIGHTSNIFSDTFKVSIQIQKDRPDKRLQEYYKFKNYRITIDKKIIYKFFKKKIFKNDPMSVIELKYNTKIEDDSIINSFSNKTTRFSKYCNGLNLLNL